MDAEDQRLSDDELLGGWRSLCAAILLRSAQELVHRTHSKERIRGRRTIRDWLCHDSGLITFSEACEACGIDKKWYLNSLAQRSNSAFSTTADLQ